MNQLIDEIKVDIDWRISQLAIIRTLPIKYSMTEKHAETIYWYAVPSIYAIWEGYIDNAFRLYITYLNQMNLTSHDLDLNVLTHAIDIHCQLKNSIVNYDTKKSVVTEMFRMMNEPLNIKHELPKGGNVNYKVVNGILTRFNLTKLDDRFESRLKRLIRFRNSVAHGENSLIIHETDIEEFKTLIEELMEEILLKIDESIKNEVYKYNSSK